MRNPSMAIHGIHRVEVIRKSSNDCHRTEFLFVGRDGKSFSLLAFTDGDEPIPLEEHGAEVPA